MKVKKVLNNNVVCAADKKGREFIVVGLGLAYCLKPGDEIPEHKIERIFTSVEEKNQLQKLAETIPAKYFDITEEIVEYLEKFLDRKLSNSIYITLMDHINFVKERADMNLLPKNPLKWSIQQYYPKEYKGAKKVVNLLEDELECKLNDDEAASIALHVINAEVDNFTLHNSLNSVKLMDQFMQILRYYTNLVDDIDDLNYQRLVTHVRFFIERVLSNRQLKEGDSLYEVIKSAYPEAFAIAEKIVKFMESKYPYKINKDEISYLVIHIERVRNRR